MRAKYATEHRCGIAVSGPRLSDDITGTDPLKDNLPLQVSLKASLQSMKSLGLDFLFSIQKNKQFI